MLNSNKSIFCPAIPNKFVELDLHSGAISVLRILDKKDHQKGHDGRPGVYHQLPGVREMEQWPGNGPANDERESHYERGGPARELRRVGGKIAKKPMQTESSIERPTGLLGFPRCDAVLL
jgi:hypothetical protein